MQIISSRVIDFFSALMEFPLNACRVERRGAWGAEPSSNSSVLLLMARVSANENAALACENAIADLGVFAHKAALHYHGPEGQSLLTSTPSSKVDGDEASIRMSICATCSPASPSPQAGRSPTSPRKSGRKEALAEKGCVDAVSVVAFAYDTYTNPSKNNGCFAQRLRRS